MTPADGKEIAWNGIRLVVPAAWEPGRIGPRHLMIESDAGPAMEIKWGPVKGRFSRRAHLRRLSKLTRARGAALREWAPPQGWLQALTRFECTGFAWEAGPEAAVGAILYCPACRTASVIQFFQPPGRRGAAGQAVAVLASLQDHRDDGRVAWAVYDIRALLPSGFALVRHRFEAGRFFLEFRDRRRTIGLFRWAPAAVLLRDRDLGRFAETVAGLDGMEFRATAVEDQPEVEGRARTDGCARRLASSLGLRPVRAACIWHVPARNRILGIVVEGRFALDPAVMETVRGGYGLVEENRPPGAHQPR
ncbi:MAG TPA: hypothetical protein VLT56_03640 [Desulfobacterales bacterium]|nr:hypothetical protein [Desulfobacterales bacterium]